MNSSNDSSIEKQAKEFYDQYETVLIATELYLIKRLEDICLRYCDSHNLPPQAIIIQTRRKSISSFINKLKRRGVMKISDRNDSATDTVGARIICWFIDDCFGILEAIKEDHGLNVIPNSVENFIEKPKETGYRSIHTLISIKPELLELELDHKNLEQNIISEIQIRTKLQDSWAEITHEFHYKAKYAGVNDTTYESLLADISNRLALEDKTILKFRDAYGNLAKNNAAHKSSNSQNES